MADSKVKEIEDLIKIVSKLPGLGPKSAQRIVLKLINNIRVKKITIKALNNLYKLYIAFPQLIN